MAGMGELKSEINFSLGTVYSPESSNFPATGIGAQPKPL